MSGSMYRIDRSWDRSVVMLTEAVPGQAVALTIELERVYPGSSLEDHVSPVDEQPHLSPKVAHRDRSPFSGRPSLSGHCGHGWPCRWLDPVESDPQRHQQRKIAAVQLDP
jgi:hypothetical protein